MIKPIREKDGKEHGKHNCKQHLKTPKLSQHYRRGQVASQRSLIEQKMLYDWRSRIGHDGLQKSAKKEQRKEQKGSNNLTEKG